MNINTLTKENIALLNALSVSLFGNKCEFDAEIDWQEVFKESRIQTVCALAFDGLRNFKKLPKDIAILWLKYASLQISNGITVIRNHSRLDAFLNENNIPYCILKGVATAYYYPDPSLRAMGDVDFLVPPEVFDEVTNKLLSDGYVTSEDDHPCHKVFKKEKIHLEMHFEPAGMPEGENHKVVEKYFADIFEKSTIGVVDGIKFNNPGELHHALVLLLHTYHHLLSEGVGLRHFCDWAVFVNNFTHQEFEEKFKAPLQEIGLWRFAQILSLTACEYIGLPYKEWMGTADQEVTNALICDILTGGNFGRKDAERRQQGDMISNRGKDGVSKSSFWQLVKNKNKSAAQNFALFKKVKILYPFGFVFMGIRYVFMVLFGKRKAVNIKSATEKAQNRRKLYEQFKLFEKGE